MQKKDIKAGVLYGYAKGTSEYRNTNPVIVLDADVLWTWHRSSGRERRQWKLSNAKRFTAPAYYSGYRGDEGYLVLFARSSTPETIATMEELYAEFAATPGNPDAVNALARKVGSMEDIFMDVVNNRWIVGEYEEAKNKERAVQEARVAKHKKALDYAAAQASFLAEVGELMAAKLERSVRITTDNTWTQKQASIPMEDLAEFLGIKSPKDRM